MKEKIQELALQAGGSHYYSVNPIQLEMFTKLVIDLCIKSVENANCTEAIRTTYDLGLEKGVKQRCVDNIKNTFGIRAD